MQCSRCQTENRTGRQFCAECGAPLALLWASCGFANEPGEKFCGGCGTPLTTASPRPGEAYASITRSVTRRPVRRRRRCHRSISYRLTVASSAAARHMPRVQSTAHWRVRAAPSGRRGESARGTGAWPSGRFNAEVAAVHIRGASRARRGGYCPRRGRSRRTSRVRATGRHREKMRLKFFFVS
jgi:hypothetical protein